MFIKSHWHVDTRIESPRNGEENSTGPWRELYLTFPHLVSIPSVKLLLLHRFNSKSSFTDVIQAVVANLLMIFFKSNNCTTCWQQSESWNSWEIKWKSVRCLFFWEFGDVPRLFLLCSLRLKFTSQERCQRLDVTTSEWAQGWFIVAFPY